MICKRAEVEGLVKQVNTDLLGISPDGIEWNTPRAFYLTSYRPGTKRIYQLERNLPSGGTELLASGTCKEVAMFLFGLLCGNEMKDNKHHE